MQEEIVDARLDFNQNLLHACISMAVAPSNKLNVDNNASLNAPTPTQNLTSSIQSARTTGDVGTLESAAASTARAVYEAKWEQMIAGGGPNRS